MLLSLAHSAVESTRAAFGCLGVLSGSRWGCFRCGVSVFSEVGVPGVVCVAVVSFECCRCSRH